MRCFIHIATIPVKVDMNVASNMGRNTSVGFAAPACALYIIIPIGMKHSPDALRMRNISMASVAVSFCLLSSCISFMALSPKGVAALSSPSIFADTFINIEPIAGWFLGMPGNKRQKRGDIMRPNICITPAFSPIFISPSHSDNMPVSPSAISKACAADVNDEPMMRLHIDKSPVKTVLHTATANAAIKNAIQI